MKADDGYRLWLRYDRIPAQRIKSIAVEGKSDTFDAIRTELDRAGLSVTRNRDEASVVIGLPQTSILIRNLQWEPELKKLGPEGFRISTITEANRQVTVIASTTDVGALYGTFHFLRLLQTEQPLDHLLIDQSPRLKLRLLNHWDNLDRSIERGYAGKSLWNWDDLPGRIEPRLRDYARANASIGINGSVLNNVNANSEILTAKYLAKVAAIANVFRPYGIRVYL
ncbi:MAG TPA: alpha-glucuronidase family glycosyl hydrolase, partial [Pyrinomonadaceae bacterium]|nr:alpha-glucuronidase family glycosyl hydrolase [Pyrinomonadaceae bacterium]